MRLLGQVGLLIALVATGCAAFAALAGWSCDDRRLRRAGTVSAIVAALALTLATATLAWALVTRDFGFDYVARYASRTLAWHYALSALWVGQAGSMLLWAWFSVLLSLAYYYIPRAGDRSLRGPTFGILMAISCFLVATIVFAADPMVASLGKPHDGAGLSPLLKHPAMLIHPPIVFLGYAAWSIPFALATAALITGQLDGQWVREARPWAVVAWIVLGAGIVLGAEWAYEELGWGGYWGWDPVENGSLIPWLTGTALIHALMVWTYCGGMKKTAMALAIATFGMCNFATFLTRSGIFSSLHAFSKSPIGWLFLGLMIVLAVGATALITLRRYDLVGRTVRGGGLLSRESLVVLACVALVSMAVAACLGTVSVALSEAVVGRRIMVGIDFYNRVLIPVGLVLLVTTAAAPLARWGSRPTRRQRRMLLLAAGAALAMGVASAIVAPSHPLVVAVSSLTAFALFSLGGALYLDARNRSPGNMGIGLLRAVRLGRKQYAGFVVHLGFFCMAIGVAGSSLESQQHEVTLGLGETIDWAGHSIRLDKMIERQLPDRLVAEARLTVSRGGGPPQTLTPAQHYHLLQEAWTTEAAIGSSWRGDLVAMIHRGEGSNRIRLTLIDNPRMRWLWLGTSVMGLGALVGLWPVANGQRRVTPVHPTSVRRRHAISEMAGTAS
ncbi:MAG: heme lyase CcmF/NrfE family subunit [Pirellulales bacterium]